MGRKILIIKMSSLGDVILSTPVAKAIKELEPDAFIGWLVEERNREVLENNPFVDEIFTWDRTLKDFFPTLKHMRGFEWDICLDIQGLFKSAVFCLLSGARKRIALEEVERGTRLFYHHLVPERPDKHAVENYLLATYFSLFLDRHNSDEAIKLAGEKTKERKEEFKPAVYLPEERTAGELLGRDSPFVVFCPGTTWPSKRWLSERWAKVGDELGRAGYKIVFLGAKNDAEIVEKIRELMDLPSIDLTGKTSIKEAGVVLRDAKLVITVDSGAMHLATAVGATVLALFGPTNPIVQGPYCEQHRVIYKDLPCSPCRNRNCPHKECMRAITWEEVLVLAKELIDR